MIALFYMMFLQAYAVDLNRRHFLSSTAAIAAQNFLPSTALTQPTPPDLVPLVAMPTTAEDLAYRTRVWSLNGQHLFAGLIRDNNLAVDLPVRLSHLEYDLARRFNRAIEDVWAEMDDVLDPWRGLGLPSMDSLVLKGLSRQKPAPAPHGYHVAMLEGLAEIHADLRRTFGAAYTYRFITSSPRTPETRVDYWYNHHSIAELAERDAETGDQIQRRLEFARSLVAIEDQMLAEGNFPRAFVEEAIAYWQRPRQEFPWESALLRRPRRFPAPSADFFRDYLNRVRTKLPKWADELEAHYLNETTNPEVRYRVPPGFNRSQLPELLADLRLNFPERSHVLVETAKGLSVRTYDTKAGLDPIEEMRIFEELRRSQAVTIVRETITISLQPSTSVTADLCVQALRAPAAVRTLDTEDHQASPREVLEQWEQPAALPAPDPLTLDHQLVLVESTPTAVPRDSD